MPTLCIAPSTESDFVELGATRKGRLYKKHILNKGPLLYPDAPGGKVTIDDEFISKLKANFDAGVCDIVQVPLAGPKNEHTEDPERNIGRVVDIEADGDKVYALIDARKHADDLGETLLGASALMSLDYTNTKTLEKVGPTLLHVAVTNRPYVTGLDEYEEVVAATASEYSSEDLVMLTAATVEKEAKDMTKDELIAALKGEGVDVAAVLAENATLKAAAPAGSPPAAQPDAALTALTQTLVDAKLVELSNGEQITTKDVVTAVAQLAGRNVELAGKVDGLERDKHATQVQNLVDKGFITPDKQEAMLALKLSNEELFLQLVPEKPIVKLTVEHGVDPSDQAPEFDVDKAVESALALARSQDMPGVPKATASA